MTDRSMELLRGTLDLLILRALRRQPLHGYSLMRWIEESTKDALQIEDGSLYPALYRLEDRGWVKSSWGVSENNRRARFYQLTPKGRAQLKTEVSEFARFTRVVFQAIDAPEPA